MLKNVNVINKRMLESVGRENYNEYMLLTGGEEIDSILDSKNPVFEMYKYKDMLIDKGIGQNVTMAYQKAHSFRCGMNAYTA